MHSLRTIESQSPPSQQARDLPQQKSKRGLRGIRVKRWRRVRHSLPNGQRVVGEQVNWRRGAIVVKSPFPHQKRAPNRNQESTNRRIKCRQPSLDEMTALDYLRITSVTCRFVVVDFVGYRQRLLGGVNGRLEVFCTGTSTQVGSGESWR